MRNLFEDDNLWNRMLKIVESWKGTPYRHLCMVKGRGADCTLFLVACLKELGVIKGEIQYEYYPRDWHIHTKEEFVKVNVIAFLEHNLRKNLGTVRIDHPDPGVVMRGDFLGFSTTKTNVTNHMSMYLGDRRMIHSIQGRGVSEMFFGEWWKKRLTTLFRIVMV